MRNNMQYLRNENNWVFQVKLRSGKPTRKLLGIKCPHCQRFFEENQGYEDWAIDAQEHITYCSPAHRRAEYGERA